MRFGYSKHLCRSCYNCKGKYCYIGKRWTFFLACKLWFNKELRQASPVIRNLLAAFKKETLRGKEYKRLWFVHMNRSIDQVNEINELKKYGK